MRIIVLVIFFIGPLSLSSNVLDQYVCNAQNVIRFKLVRSRSDLDNDGDERRKEFTFPPEYCHQIFGQSENIFGYKNLRINLYYSACKLTRFMSVNYSEKVASEMSQGVPPDDIYAIMNEKLGGTCLTNIDQFSSLLETDHEFKPFGTQLDSIIITDRASIIR